MKDTFRLRAMTWHFFCIFTVKVKLGFVVRYTCATNCWPRFVIVRLKLFSSTLLFALDIFVDPKSLTRNWDLTGWRHQKTAWWWYPGRASWADSLSPSHLQKKVTLTLRHLSHCTPPDADLKRVSCRRNEGIYCKPTLTALKEKESVR